jgi:predicted enzyme related to lactoylglutathione lyase
MPEKLSDIGQIAITVSDVATALPSYRDVLGLPFLFSASPNLAFLQAGAIRIMLSTPEGGGVVGANSVLYFKVPDLATAHAEIVGRGAGDERPPARSQDARPRTLAGIRSGPRQQPGWTHGGTPSLRLAQARHAPAEGI